MKQEDKELLLKDLCARLPYNVKVKFKYVINSPEIVTGINFYNEIIIESDNAVCEIEDVKPYLFPFTNDLLDKATEESINCYVKLITLDCDLYNNESEKLEQEKLSLKAKEYTSIVDYCYKNHIDINRLIPKGLAIDATRLNIY